MSLLFDGVDDKIVTPYLTFDTIVFDVKLTNYDLFSLQTPSVSVYKDNYVLWSADSVVWQISINSGSSYAGMNGHTLANSRTTFQLRGSTQQTFNTVVTLFSDGGTYYGEGELFSVRFLLAGNTQAFYDMSTGTVQDQSGNGKHATLTGGTWTVTPGGPSGPEPIRHTLSFSENVNLSETLTKRASRFKTFNDSITTTDAIAKRLSVVVADAIAMSENESGDTNKSVSDSLTLEDNQAGLTAKSMIDSLIISDDANKAATRVISDNISFDESLSERIERNLSDFIPINDNISLSNSNTRSINLTDSIVILDSISKSLTRSIADNVDLSDKDDETVLKSLVDSVTLTDSLSTFGGKTILLTDSINVTDSISTTKQLNRFFAESVSISDSIGKQAAQSIKLFDVIVSEDNISVFNPNAPELIGKIYLKGKRELFVYLRGERDLVVNLKGKRTIFINLKGGLNMVTNQNFSIPAGNARTIVIDLNEPNLTGVSATWTMRKRGANTETLMKQGSVIDGKVHIVLNKADTEQLSGLFEHECDVIDQSGNESTVTRGTVNIK